MRYRILHRSTEVHIKVKMQSKWGKILLCRHHCTKNHVIVIIVYWIIHSQQWQLLSIFCTFLHRSYFFPLRRAYDLFCLFAGSKVICYTHRCILLPNSNHRGKIDTDSLLNFQHFLLLSSTSSPGITFSKPVKGRPWPLGRNQISPSLPL